MAGVSRTVGLRRSRSRGTLGRLAVEVNPGTGSNSRPLASPQDSAGRGDLPGRGISTESSFPSKQWFLQQLAWLKAASRLSPLAPPQELTAEGAN